MGKDSIKKYYIAIIDINDATNGKKCAYKEVEGKEVKVPGFEDFDFFYRKNEQLFEITELNTGLLVVPTGRRTLKEAIEEAANVLKRYTKEKLKQTIQERIEKGFISPLCKCAKVNKKTKTSIIAAKIVKIANLITSQGYATVKLNRTLYKLQNGKVLDFKNNEEVGTYKWKQGKKGKYAEVQMNNDDVLFVRKTNGKFVVFKKYLTGGDAMSEDEKGGIVSMSKVGKENKNGSNNIQK